MLTQIGTFRNVGNIIAACYKVYNFEIFIYHTHNKIFLTK